jgi:hypothetical protein
MIVNVLNISVASHFKFQVGLFLFARCHIQVWETLKMTWILKEAMKDERGCKRMMGDSR